MLKIIVLGISIGIVGVGGAAVLASKQSEQPSIIMDNNGTPQITSMFKVVLG